MLRPSLPPLEPLNEAVTIQCDAPWGRYVARLDAPARADLATALERLHRRLSVDLEHVWERIEPAGEEGTLGIAALLLRPERFTQPVRFLAKHGVQSSAQNAPLGPELVTVRVQSLALGSLTEHALDAAFVSSLSAELLGSGARTSAEACIVGVLVAMLQEELSRTEATRV